MKQSKAKHRIHGETKKAIQVYLTPTTIGWLQGKADLEGVSRSEWLELYLREDVTYPET